jgi:hypothetical protein
MSRAGVCLSLAAAALGAVLGCQTVDLGAPPADVNACEPGQQWFIDQVWPNFLGADYKMPPDNTVVHCYDSNCHGPNPKGQLALVIPAEAGTIPFPPDWASNYISASSLMNCSDAADSRLLILPEGLQAHGGGPLIMQGGPEAMLVEQWVTMP